MNDIALKHNFGKDGKIYFFCPRLDDKDEVHPMAIFFGPVELVYSAGVKYV